jgi:hypothetical protein
VIAWLPEKPACFSRLSTLPSEASIAASISSASQWPPSSSACSIE